MKLHFVVFITDDKMNKIRIYRMTIASVWYDEDAEHVKEFEMHYKVARAGSIRGTRRNLAKRGASHFQQNVYRKFKRWIPKKKIRVSFEREQPGLKTQKLIKIEIRRMEGTGKRNRWKAIPLPSRVLNYVKKKRKFKNR